MQSCWCFIIIYYYSRYIVIIKDFHIFVNCDITLILYLKCIHCFLKRRVLQFEKIASSRKFVKLLSKGAIIFLTSSRRSLVLFTMLTFICGVTDERYTIIKKESKLENHLYLEKNKY